MGGGWFGYVVSIMGCGLVVALIAGSTMFLYGWSRVRKNEPRGSVKSLSADEDD